MVISVVEYSMLFKQLVFVVLASTCENGTMHIFKLHRIHCKYDKLCIHTDKNLTIL